MCRIVGLEPIVDHESRILILGSMPSVISLKEAMYYANKTNRFWQILEVLYGSYSKLELLKRSKIALWDICHSCIRETSADAKIKDIEPNDIQTLLDTYPNIQKVICNGKKSYETLTKFFPNINAICLPSTSSANAQYRLDDLVKLYRKELIV